MSNNLHDFSGAVTVKAKDLQADSAYLYEWHIHGGIPVGCLWMADTQEGGNLLL